MRSRLSKQACLLALVAVVMSAPNAVAQDARSLSSDMVGQWELSTAGRDKTCVVTLKNETSPQGLKLELEKGCGDALPFAKSIAAWSVKGLDIVRLQDAKGESVIDFTEVESGIFEGRREGEGIYLLQNLAAARALTKSTDQLIGDWWRVSRRPCGASSAVNCCCGRPRARSGASRPMTTRSGGAFPTAPIR
jgi:hypothetical protein